MSWFADFKEFSVFTVLCLAVALVGGVLALVKRDKMKPIMIVTGVLEVAAIAAALIWFAVTKDVSDSAFGSVEMSKGVFSILVVALVVVMILLMVLSGRKEKWTARDLANAAICVAMSFILSCIKLYEMPQGGSITPASLLPLVLYMVAFGPGRGLVVGFAYGLLQLLQFLPLVVLPGIVRQIFFLHLRPTGDRHNQKRHPRVFPESGNSLTIFLKNAGLVIQQYLVQMAVLAKVHAAFGRARTVIAAAVLFPHGEVHFRVQRNEKAAQREMIAHITFDIVHGAAADQRIEIHRVQRFQHTVFIFGEFLLRQ